MKRKYDFIFSLGSACLCSQTLRNAKLQYASYPLDWVWGGDLTRRTELVMTDFKGWYEKADFRIRPSANAYGHETYFNVKTEMLFPHAFPKGPHIDVCYDEVRARADRQVERFYDRIGKSRRVLIVWIGDPRDKVRVTADAVRASLARFSARWPGVTFAFLAFDCQVGLDRELMETERGEGFVIYRFDYKSYVNGASDYMFRPELIEPFFIGIRARDYRTWADLRHYRKAKEAREFERYGVTSFWPYWRKKTWRKIKRALGFRKITDLDRGL